MREDTVAMRTALFAARADVAFIAGPRCKTFAGIRGELLKLKKRPTADRALEKIRGLSDVTPRQTAQFTVGNTLYWTTILFAACAAR